MTNFFIFDGRNSLDFGIRIENYPEVSFPERVYETYQVPGRSGDLVYDTGAYGNVTQSYSCWYKAPKDANAYEILQYISRWLLSPVGYQVLEDSCFPAYFRRAIYSGPADISSFFAKYGRATLDFTCMPQKWLISGQSALAVSSGAQLYNEGEPALPLIEVAGSGEGVLNIGSYVVTLSDIPSAGLTIDCDAQDALSGTENKNSLLTLSNGFPVLPHGASGITFSGGITSVKITPRWWIL